MTRMSEFVALISSDRLRVATGLWMVPPNRLDNIVEEAHRNTLHPVDVRERLLFSMEPGTRFASITPDRVIQLLDVISGEKGDWAGALIFNLDLLLARLKSTDIQVVWQDFFTALPHRRQGIIVVMPATAFNLLPSEYQLNYWCGKEIRIITTD